MLRKTNFLSISVLLSEIAIFLTREVLCEFPQKCLETTEKHSLAVRGSLCREKQVFVKIFPILQV